jgi:hypothetical protein
MKGIDSIQINGCPYCDIFINEESPTKLFYPKQSDIKKIDDFVIVKNKDKAFVIVSDHVETIGKEQWGRILYRAKKIFGETSKVSICNDKYSEHWHAIVETSMNLDKLSDLRGD